MTATTAIVTRTKNRPLLLQRAVQSILAQNSEDWIHIIVNDGGNRSDVDTIIAEHSERYRGRIRVVHNEQSVGMEAASNIGIRIADSRFILIHDDDDTLDPTFLTRTTAYLSAPPDASIRGVATMVLRIEESIKGNRVIEIRRRLFRALPPSLAMADLSVTNPVPPISFLFSRAALEATGLFDASLPVLGDWEFLIRFLLHFNIGVIQEPLAHYHIRTHATGIDANSIIGGVNKHRFYDSIIRNRFLRSEHAALGLLLQQGATQSDAHMQLCRLYEHTAIGGFIRLWARFVNHSIPKAP